MNEQSNQTQKEPQPQAIQSIAHYTHVIPKIIVGVLLFLTGLSSGYILSGYKSSTQQATNQIAHVPPQITQPLPPTSPPTQHIPTPPSDTSTNWQEYSNPKNEFSIQVAPGFAHSYTQNTYFGGHTIDQESFSKGVSAGSGFSGESLQILIYHKTENEIWDYGSTQTGPKAIVSSISIDGNTVKKVLGLPFGTVFIGPLVHDGYIYNIVIDGSMDGNAYTNVYAMLSTFKFIN